LPVEAVELSVLDLRDDIWNLDVYVSKFITGLKRMLGEHTEKGLCWRFSLNSGSGKGLAVGCGWREGEPDANKAAESILAAHRATRVLILTRIIRTIRIISFKEME